MISSATDIGGLLGANLAVTYIAAKGHRTRWVALGMLIISFTSFLRTLPYLLYEGGEKVKLYTKEYGNQFDDENQQKNNSGKSAFTIQNILLLKNIELSVLSLLSSI